MKERSWIWLLFALVLYVGVNASGLQAQNVKRYIVKLQDEPVIGHLSRQGRTSIKSQLQSASASQYRRQLASKRQALRRRIESLQQAKVETELDTAYNGLVVSLRPEDVDSVKSQPGVENVIPSINYHKLLDAALPLVNLPEAWTNRAIGGEPNAGVGIKIGIIDTGIDINHPMFQDPSLTIPMGYPKYTAPTPQCNASDQAFTNSKVIVARNYVTLLSNPDQNCDAEDRDGHGTFGAAIAAGRRVTAPLASVAGAAPKAYLGSYKVFGTPGQNDDASLGAIMAAIDDAINDKMDVINLSLGASSNELPGDDPLEQQVARAAAAGVVVVVAAGNEGPGTGTVTSPGTSPVVITVGASNNGRILANPLLITATIAVPASLQTIAALPGSGPKLTANVGAAPLVDVNSVDVNGIACTSLSGGSLNGKIVLIRRGGCTFANKVLNATNGGAAAVVIYNNQAGQPPVLMDVGSSTNIPSVMIGNLDGMALASFLAAPGISIQATLQAQQSAIPTNPNRMAAFSANGPSTDLSIKPDIVAPGATIYSAAQRNFPLGEQYDASGFTIFSGTSFSSPLVAGSAAIVKQANPTWTPVQIKSALVNTAGNVMTTHQGSFASVLAQGNGLVNVAAALNSTLLVTPVSISFSSLTGTGPVAPVTVNIRNVGQIADNLTVTVTPTVANGATITASPTTLSLAPGADGSINVSASLSVATGTIEGFLTIAGQNSLAKVTIPYWGALSRASVNAGGVINAASFSFGSPDVAPGAIISIFGSNLANTTESAVSLPLPRSLGGATVMIGNRAAPLLFVSPTQINAQVPFELSGASSPPLVVNLNGISSTPVTVPLVTAAPGIFTLGQNGTGRGAILHADGTPVNPSNPARSGETVLLYATGLGTVTPTVTSGTQALSSPVSITRITPSVTIADIDAPVAFSGLAPGFVGLYQVNLQVPDGIPTGEQTLVLTANGAQSNPVTISVAE
ncbi:MAG: S8 family serine peptidase [Acidobacteria bacterium]|nr:S8 family serine peptidase [Acidobacteriota bacterium]